MEGPARSPTRGLVVQEAFRGGPGEGAPCVEGPPAAAAGLEARALSLLRGLRTALSAPDPAGPLPAASWESLMGLQRGAPFPLPRLRATAGRPGLGRAGDTNPSRSVWCMSACLGDL